MSTNTKFNIKSLLWEYYTQNRKIINLYFVLSCFIVILEIALAKYYGSVIGSLKDKKKHKQVKGQFIALAALWITLQLSNMFNNWMNAYIIPSVQSFIRIKLIAQIMELYKENYKEQDIGTIIARLIRLPNIIKNLVYQLKNNIIPLILTSLVTLGYISYININMGIICLSSLIIYFYVLYMLSTKCLSISLKMNDEYDKLYEDVSDTLSNLLHVYANNEVEAELDRTIKNQLETDSYYKASIECASKYKLIFNATYTLIFFGVNGYSYYLMTKNIIKLDDVISILIITISLMDEMNSFVKELDYIMYNLATIDQIQQSFDEIMNSIGNKRSGTRKVGKIGGGGVGGDIIFSNLSVSYKGAPHKIFDNYNLTINEGEKIALIGKIGSGKSTLTKILLKLNTDYSGDVLIGEDNIRNINVDDLRKAIIYAPQHPLLFNRTIYENITYGSSKHIPKKAVQELFDKYGLTFSLNKMCGKNGEHLSGGQRQLVFLMRCLFKDANILIVDEPTSSLDKETREMVMNILKDLMEGKTTIFITHDDELLTYVDRVVNLDDKN